MNRRRLPLWPLGLLLLLAGAGAAFLLLQPGRTHWFSDPYKVRPWSQRARLLAPTNPPPFKPNPKVIESIIESMTVTSISEDQVQLQITTAETPTGAGLHWQVVHADEQLNAKLGIGDATVQVAYLATGWGRPTNRTTVRDPNYFRVPGKFFRPDLTPFQPEDFKRTKIRKWNLTLSYHDGMPAADFTLRFEHIAGWKLLGLHAYDGRTHAPIHGGGYSHGTRDHGSHVGTELALWHDAPVDLVLDLALGPPEIFEFPARTNTWQEFPGGAVTLVAMIDGDERSWSSSSDGQTQTSTIRFEPKPERPQCSLVFYCQPNAHPAPIDFELLDRQGKVLGGGGGGSSGRMAIKGARTASTNVATVRLKYYPNHRRVVFHLPRLPGLPEFNRNVRNLLDVKVPFVYFPAQYRMQSWIERMLQVQLQQSTAPTVPPGTFPVEFTDATVGEVLKFYLDLFPPGTQPHLDAEACTLRLGPSATYAMLRRIGEWLKGKFR